VTLNDSSNLSLSEVQDTQAKLRQWAVHRIPVVLLHALAWGAVCAVAFVSATWLLGQFQPLNTPAAYWLAGVASFLFFGSWPILDFVLEFLFHRRALAALVDRLSAGESIPRTGTHMLSSVRPRPARKS